MNPPHGQTNHRCDIAVGALYQIINLYKTILMYPVVIFDFDLKKQPTKLENRK
jgi:hypothetical protein